MSRVLFPEEVRTVKDWNGQQISKRVFNELRSGCIVRCVISNEVLGSSEALYFEILEIKDGTFWGKTLDTYRLGNDYIGLPTDTVFTFRKNHIMEIPIMWQSKYLRKRLRKYLVE